MHDEVAQPAPGGDVPAVDSWKEDLRRQFELWLESLEDIPETQELRDAPDLYSLYEELTALRNETRKGNRRSAEVFGQVGESLGQARRFLEESMGELATRSFHRSHPFRKAPRASGYSADEHASHRV